LYGLLREGDRYADGSDNEDWQGESQQDSIEKFSICVHKKILQSTNLSVNEKQLSARLPWLLILDVDHPNDTLVRAKGNMHFGGGCRFR
jgi:hypothetical protein